jgi:hypothetical protein
MVRNAAKTTRKANDKVKAKASEPLKEGPLHRGTKMSPRYPGPLKPNEPVLVLTGF